jgi:hypothetical protein
MITHTATLSRYLGLRFSQLRRRLFIGVIALANDRLCRAPRLIAGRPALPFACECPGFLFYGLTKAVNAVFVSAMGGSQLHMPAHPATKWIS